MLDFRNRWILLAFTCAPATGRIKNKLILSCIFIFFFCWIHANDSITNPLVLGAKSHYGFILSHSKRIRNISHTNPRGFNVSVSWLSLTRKAWTRMDGYSRSGFAFYYFDYANPGVLGSSYNLLMQFEPFITYRRKLYFTARFGAGISYLTKVYDRETNPTNLAWSTPISFMGTITLNMQYRINKRLNLHLGGDYSHISNGGIKQPNWGLNFPVLSFGIDYTMQDVNYWDRSVVFDTGGHYNKWFVQIEPFATVKTIGISDDFEDIDRTKDDAEDRTEEHKTWIYGLAAYYNHSLSKRHVLCAGVELVNDGYVAGKKVIEGKDVDHKQANLLLGHQVLIGKFAFSIKFGVYVYSPYKHVDPLYQRYTLTYKFNERIYTGVSIKAHRHMADVFDWRWGIILF